MGSVGSKADSGENTDYTDAKIRTVIDNWVNGDYAYIKNNPDSVEAQELEDVIRSLPAYSNGTVYRGAVVNTISDIQQLKKGTIRTFEHITSWSTNETIAVNHTLKHEYGARVIYVSDTMSKGADISKYSNKEESEVLATSGVKVKITKVDKKKYKKDGIWIVYVKEI